MARGNVHKGGTGGGGSARKRAGARKTALGPVRMEGVSDIGRASANQDRFLTRELRVGSGRTAFLCAVADGSRTESGARSASEIALAKLDARLQEDWDSLSDVDKARATPPSRSRRSSTASWSSPTSATAAAIS